MLALVMLVCLCRRVCVPDGVAVAPCGLVVLVVCWLCVGGVLPGACPIVVWCVGVLVVCFLRFHPFVVGGVCG